MEKEVSNVILGVAGRADRFRLKYGWFTFCLSIRPITTRHAIEISAEISQVKEVDSTKDMFSAFNYGIGDMRHIARAIAIATGSRWRGIVTKAILDLPLKDIETLWEIVKRQMDTERFFFIIVSTGRLNLLKAKEEQ